MVPYEYAPVTCCSMLMTFMVPLFFDRLLFAMIVVRDFSSPAVPIHIAELRLPCGFEAGVVHIMPANLVYIHDS